MSSYNWHWVRAPIAGIQHLDISDCPLLTDVGFQYRYLTGISSLDTSRCPLITDTAVVHLAGIDSFRMRGCDQDAITSNAFSHLEGVRSLNMGGCNAGSMTSAALQHLAGIHELNIAGCEFEVDMEAFSKLSLTSTSHYCSLNLHGAPQEALSTHARMLAAMRVFQGNTIIALSL